MSTATQKETADASVPSARKSWFARHKILTAAFLFALAVVIGGTVLAWPTIKLRFHSQYILALDEIRKDNSVIEKLGQPIETVRIFPGGRVEANGDNGTASFFFDVAGPKGIANVSVMSRLLQGIWGFTKIELTFADQQRIDLAQKLQQQAGDDTPRFNPGTAQPAAKKPDLPMNIEINIPGMPAEPAK